MLSMRKLSVFMAILVVLGTALGWWWPKAQQFDFDSDMFGYYRGLGIVEEDSLFFGKSYYLITWKDDGDWNVWYRRPGYNRFQSFYKNGNIRAQGECFVKLLGAHYRPAPDIENVKSGRYFKPDGTLSSEVKNGTGLQTYWLNDGVKVWEVEVSDFKRVRHSRWYRNGQLQQTLDYVQGALEGPLVSYYPSGERKTEGAYSGGERVGRWVRYNRDGTIKGTEDY